jgi:hypothetical protein
MVMVGGQFMFEPISPADAQPNQEDKDALSGESKQYAFMFEIGGMF